MRGGHGGQERRGGRTDVEIPRELDTDVQYRPADGGVGIDGADDKGVLRQIPGGAAVQTVDRWPGTFGSLPQRQG